MSAPIKSNHVCFKADKRSVSPHRFPLLRSGSLSSRPKTQSSSRSTTPHSSRPTTPSNSNGQRRVRSLCSPFFYYIKRKMTSLLLCFAKILCLRVTEAVQHIFLSSQCPSEPRKSASMRIPAERDNSKDVEQYPSKSKRLLKALLSRRKSKKDDMLYTYLDEY